MAGITYNGQMYEKERINQILVIRPRPNPHFEIHRESCHYHYVSSNESNQNTTQKKVMYYIELCCTTLLKLFKGVQLLRLSTIECKY